MMYSRFSIVTLASVVLLLTIPNNAVAAGSLATGSFTITIQGYVITGELFDVTGHQSGVKLLMSINQTFSIPGGTAHIVGTGVWIGATTDSIIIGSIDGVNGSIHACVLIACQDAIFTGSGNWNGTVTAVSSGLLQGSGTFEGSLNFTSLKPPSEAPVSGNWTTTLNL